VVDAGDFPDVVDVIRDFLERARLGFECAQEVRERLGRFVRIVRVHGFELAFLVQHVRGLLGCGRVDEPRIEVHHHDPAILREPCQNAVGHVAPVIGKRARR
jgi:hypothetical protein